MGRPATRKPRIRTKEVTLHMSVAAFLRHAWPEHLLWTHFPAGERRDARTGAKLKAMGLHPGWGDFIFVLPNGQFAEWELKVVGGELSPVQIAHRDRLLALGCGHAVIRSLDEAEAVGTRWLGKFGLRLRARTVQRPEAPIMEAVVE